MTTGLLCVCAGLTGCATKPNSIDPYEPYNRVVFDFNQDVYTMVKPVIHGYENITPTFFRTGVRNFFNNIDMVPTIGNDLLQFNFKWALEDTTRLVLNSTLGVFGLFDIASHVGLYQRDQSFGLTLAKWGATKSPYLILPFYGPITGRGLLGLVPDFFMSPLTYIDKGHVYYPMEALKYTQKASDLLPKQDDITAMAIDPYVALRNAYLQNQQLLIWQVKNEDKPLSDAPVYQQSSFAPIPGEEEMPSDLELHAIAS